MKQLKNIPLVLGALVGSVLLVAILSHYPGSISLEWSSMGGRVTLDGRTSVEAAE